MAFKSKLNLNAKIFNAEERKRAFSNVAMRSAREMKESLRRKMVESKPSGRIERKQSGGGRGFGRSFRRSARGQRPALDTTTLSSAFDARRTGDNSAIVDIKDKINPGNGESAREYGERLQNVLGRQVMTKSDVGEAEKDFKRRSENTLAGLLK